MDKTIKINLAGVLFQIDEEAYYILRDYLKAIETRFKDVPGGDETIEDIESRIAEIFQSQKGLAGVISKENVEAMITTIGKPGDFDQHESQQEPQPASYKRRRLYKNPDDKIIGGVCGGLGAYMDMDPVWVRLWFIILAAMGIGFFLYIALLIALPNALTETQKKEMRRDYYTHRSFRSENSPSNSSYYSANVSDNTSKASGALNEVLKAIWRVCYIILRIFLIIFGFAFVLTGFLTILCFLMVFVFRYPGAFSTDAFNMHLAYIPDFLNYIVNPLVAPWILALTLIAVFLPMLALIYWGIKMIFWFRVEDGVFSLIGLVLWVITLTVLAMILFNEGISFAETARYSTKKIFSHPPDTLYIKTENKVSDLKFEKELSLNQERYTVFINEEKKELYIRPYLNINDFYDNAAKVEVIKRSSGRSEISAAKRAEELLYNFQISGDTLFLDEYFTIPAGHKWTADNIRINLSVPKGTILRFDSASENLLHRHSWYEDDEDSDSIRSSGKSSWELTDKGLKSVDKYSDKYK